MKDLYEKRFLGWAINLFSKSDLFSIIQRKDGRAGVTLVRPPSFVVKMKKIDNYYANLIEV